MGISVPFQKVWCVATVVQDPSAKKLFDPPLAPRNLIQLYLLRLFRYAFQKEINPFPTFFRVDINAL